VAGFGIDLAARHDQEIVLAGKVPYLLVGPESVVVGEAYTVQSQRLGTLDQFVHAHETVIRVGIAVSMKIYQQKLVIQPGHAVYANDNKPKHSKPIGC
jgi:hypothetical protein